MNANRSPLSQEVYGAFDLPKLQSAVNEACCNLMHPYPIALLGALSVACLACQQSGYARLPHGVRNNLAAIRTADTFRAQLGRIELSKAMQVVGAHSKKVVFWS